jgi:hypothetical protein
LQIFTKCRLFFVFKLFFHENSGCGTLLFLKGFNESNPVGETGFIGKGVESEFFYIVPVTELYKVTDPVFIDPGTEIGFEVLIYNQR